MDATQMHFYVPSGYKSGEGSVQEELEMLLQSENKVGFNQETSFGSCS